MALGLSKAPPAPVVAINGEPAAVRVNRAIGELRQGRAVVVEGTEGVVLTAAANAVAAEQLGAMRALGCGPVLLGLTAARGAALGLAGAGPEGLALEVPATADPVWLRHMAFAPVGEAPCEPAWPMGPVAAAAVSLARQARLPPAVAFVPVVPSAVAAALAAG